MWGGGCFPLKSCKDLLSQQALLATGKVGGSPLCRWALFNNLLMTSGFALLCFLCPLDPRAKGFDNESTE